MSDLERAPHKTVDFVNSLIGVAECDSSDSGSKKLIQHMVDIIIELKMGKKKVEDEMEKERKKFKETEAKLNQGEKLSAMEKEELTKLLETEKAKNRAFQIQKKQLEDEVEESLSDDSERVILNVGGTLFETTQKTLTSVPNTYFTALFNGNFKISRNEQGHIFLDRSPSLFQYILDHLRTHKKYVKDDISSETVGNVYLPHLKEEANYFGLENSMFAFQPGSELGFILFHFEPKRYQSSLTFTTRHFFKWNFSRPSEDLVFGFEALGHCCKSKNTVTFSWGSPLCFILDGQQKFPEFSKLTLNDSLVMDFNPVWGTIYIFINQRHEEFFTIPSGYQWRLFVQSKKELEFTVSLVSAQEMTFYADQAQNIETVNACDDCDDSDD